MARSPKYWYNKIIDEKNTMANLSVYTPNVDNADTLFADVNSNSKVSIVRLMFWCVAVGYWVLDVLFDLYKIDLEGIAARSRYGTLPWYVSVSKEYQHGDNLSQINLEWKYAVVDPSIQVVKLAAAKEGVGVVNIKVAKIVSVDPEPLSGAELIGFTAYMSKRKPAGIYLNIINDLPDELQLPLYVNFDPLVLTATGELISSPGTYPVEDAVNLYLKSLDFDGRFELMSLIDFVQNAIGVVSAYAGAASARYGANPFVPFLQNYYPNAGYMVIDPLNPLSTTITYTPHV